MAPEVAGGSDAIFQIIGVKHFFEADGDCFKVAAGESAVSGKALGENQEIGFLLRDVIVIRAEKAADVGESVLLRGERAAIGKRKNLACDIEGLPIRIARLTLPNEPGVFGEAAGVEIQRNSRLLTNALYG